MKKILFLAAFLSIIALSGCDLFEKTSPTDENAGASTAEETLPGTTSPLRMGAKEINMVSGDLFFVPNKLILKVNEPVKLKFNNAGSHTFAVDAFGINAQLTGTSTSVEFTPVKTGTFEFYCSAPGHREGGMKGTLTIIE